MPIYDWKCEADHRFTKRAGYDTEVMFCDCGLTASRQSVYRINFGGFASTTVGQADFEADYRRFDEATAELAYKKERAEDSAQTRLADPPLYSAGKAKAKAMESAGLSADNIST